MLKLSGSSLWQSQLLSILLPKPAMLLAVFLSPPSPSIHSRWVLIQALHKWLELWGNSERNCNVNSRYSIKSWKHSQLMKDLCACLCVYLYSLTGWYLIVVFLNSIWRMNTKHLLFLLLQRQYLQLKPLWWQSLCSIRFRVLLFCCLQPFKSLW